MSSPIRLQPLTRVFEEVGKTSFNTLWFDDFFPCCDYISIDCHKQGFIYTIRFYFDGISVKITHDKGNKCTIIYDGLKK